MKAGLEVIEIRLTEQYTLMEQTLAELQTQGDFLTQQLEALRNYNNR